MQQGVSQLARDISAPRYRTLPNRAQLLVLISGCVLAAAVGPIVANSPSLAYGLAAILLLVTALSRTATRPIGSILIVAVIAASALIDLPQHIRTGPTSGQGAESFALAALVVFLCLNGYVRADIPDVRRLLPLPLFLAWAVISFSWGHLTQQGVQNVLVYTCFVGMVFVGATLGRAKPLHTYHVLNRGFQFAAIVGMGLYAVSFVIAGHGNRLVVSPRPFGLFGVLVVSWFMAAHVNGVRYAKYVVLAAVLLTLLSLSRSALAAQFAVIVLAQLATTRDFRSTVRTLAVVVVVATTALAAVILYAPLNHRFFGGDTKQIGGISLNVTGRDALWSANWAWFKERPVIGWGAGSSDQMTSALPGAFSGHPHNDYLRLLVDFGVVGLVIWVIGYFRLLRRTWQLWRRTVLWRSPESHVCGAAFLGLMGIAMSMLVDNPLIEVGKMAPLGALAGVAIGMCAATAAAPAASAAGALADSRAEGEPAVP